MKISMGIVFLSALAVVTAEKDDKSKIREKKGTAEKKQGKRGLFDFGYGYDGFHLGGAPYDLGYDHAVKTVSIKHVAVPYPAPYAVPVEKHIPYPVKVPIAVPVEKPYPVPVVKPYPVAVEKPVPYPVDKPIPYPVKVPVKVPVYHSVPVPYPKPVPVAVEKPIPVPVSQPIYYPKAVPLSLGHSYSYSGLGGYGFHSGLGFGYDTGYHH